jgi:hypothetical protein
MTQELCRAIACYYLETKKFVENVALFDLDFFAQEELGEAFPSGEG